MTTIYYNTKPVSGLVNRACDAVEQQLEGQSSNIDCDCVGRFTFLQGLDADLTCNTKEFVSKVHSIVVWPRRTLKLPRVYSVEPA